LVLILGGLALLVTLPTSARGGYIDDVSVLSESAVQATDTMSSSTASPSSMREQLPTESDLLVEYMESAAKKLSMQEGNGFGSPSVSGPNSTTPSVGILTLTDFPQAQLAAWMTWSDQTSRPSPHLDRLFRPPRVG